MSDAFRVRPYKKNQNEFRSSQERFTKRQLQLIFLSNDDRAKKVLSEEQTRLNWLTTTTSSFGREVSVRLEVLALVPATILLAVAASFLDRFHRFVLVYPTILTLFCFFIPLDIILKNEKIRTFAVRCYLEPFKRQFEGLPTKCLFLRRKRKVRPWLSIIV